MGSRTEHVLGLAKPTLGSEAPRLHAGDRRVGPLDQLPMPNGKIDSHLVEPVVAVLPGIARVSPVQDLIGDQVGAVLSMTTRSREVAPNPQRQDYDYGGPRPDRPA